MAGYVNKVTLLGNLGADPEVRSFQNGGRVLTFSLATGESWTDRNSGERRERTTWHRVCVHVERLVDVAEKYLRKGSKVYVEGKLENCEWTGEDGTKRYSTEIALRPFHSELVLLGEPGGRGDGSRPASRREAAPAGSADGYSQRQDDRDDDIPF